MATNLRSWGRYPPFPQAAHPCHWRADLPAELERVTAAHGATLAFGNGRSYGDSCLASSDHVLHLRALDRFISADWTRGVIVAEAGVTLEEVLALALPRGWFLPVTPGTKFVTLGGAVANDVHGKNHHVKGTFGRHVNSFGLVRSDSPPRVCSRERDAELFAGTVGGLGLTGIIEWVELQLMPVRSCMMDVTTIRFGSLAEFFQLSLELDHSHDYAVAWIDCLARGASAGRGVYSVADHAPSGGLDPVAARAFTVPVTPPISAMNRLSLRLFNSIYYGAHKAGRHQHSMHCEPFFYPLDRLLQWNRMYGPRGFQQYQCVVPDLQAEPATRALLESIAASGSGSFLAVMKRCGGIESPGLMSFPMPGVSLALDFPQHDSLDAKLFPRLDAIVREAGGRLYPAKDAHMSGDDFRRSYPAWERVEALRDPALCSRFWTRVTQQ